MVMTCMEKKREEKELCEIQVKGFLIFLTTGRIDPIFSVGNVCSQMVGLTIFVE